jgi:hypothetical protein
VLTCSDYRVNAAGQAHDTSYSPEEHGHEEDPEDQEMEDEGAGVIPLAWWAPGHQAVR